MDVPLGNHSRQVTTNPVVLYMEGNTAGPDVRLLGDGGADSAGLQPAALFFSVNVLEDPPFARV